MPFEKKTGIYSSRLVSGDTQDKDSRSQCRDESLNHVFYNSTIELLPLNIIVTMCILMHTIMSIMPMITQNRHNNTSPIISIILQRKKIKEIIDN